MPFLPPPLSRTKRDTYLRALTVKHHHLGSPFTNWLAVVQELEGILFAQTDKASSMLAFNGIAVSILALDITFLPRSVPALWLLTVSAVICLLCCFSIWPSSDEARDSEREAQHLLGLLAARSMLINVSVLCSLAALLVLVLSPREPRRSPDTSPPVTWRTTIGPFCRGRHDALCATASDSGWGAPLTPQAFTAKLRDYLATHDATHVTVVGSADRTELRARMRERYGDNQALARSRAEWIRQGIERTWPGATPMPAALVLTRGAAILDTALVASREDRGVLVEVELQRTVNREP